MVKLGFWKKLKDMGSKVIGGVKKTIGKAVKIIPNVIKKIKPFVDPLLKVIPFGNYVSTGMDVASGVSQIADNVFNQGGSIPQAAQDLQIGWNQLKQLPGPNHPHIISTHGPIIEDLHNADTGVALTPYGQRLN